MAKKAGIMSLSLRQLNNLKGEKVFIDKSDNCLQFGDSQLGFGLCRVERELSTRKR